MTSKDSNSARPSVATDRNPKVAEKLEQKELRDKIIDALCFRQTKDYFARKGEIVPTDSQVDNIEALIQSQVASAVNEARIDQLKKDKETVNKLREIFITNDLPSLLTHADGATDEAIKNWNALRTMITRDFDKELEDLEATTKP